MPTVKPQASALHPEGQPMFRSIALRPLALVLALALAAPVAFAGDEGIDKVMGSITARAGEKYGNLSTVNGSIRIESGATAQDVETVNGSVRVDSSANVGSAQTVNGSIKVADNARIGGLETVNGSIRVGPQTRVDGGVETVNGSVFVDRGGRITRNVTTVNGDIGLVATELDGGIETVNGDITVGIDSRVRGGIKIEKPTSNWMPINLNKRRPRVIIGPNAVVEGALVFEREVTLYVHGSARIGKISGATPIRYEGARAPQD